jgi:pimeloyl-ACP methyl ester carboxylesterase
MSVNLPVFLVRARGMAQTVTKTVVFIHGAFCGGWCFEDFVPEFEARGFACHAPDLRFHVSGPARAPDPRLAQTSIADYKRDMEELIAGLPERPVIVGHSMGGLIGQQLAAKGLARSLVLLASGAPWGILPSSDAELALAMGLMRASPFWDRALNPSFEVARLDSLASLDPAAQRRVFDRFSAETGRALFELFFWMFDKQRTTAVETTKVACPVLVISGSDDKVVSAATGRKIAALYPSATFHEAAGRGHFLIMEEGSSQLAARCADWIEKA